MKKNFSVCLYHYIIQEKVPKIKYEEQKIVELVLYKIHYCSLKKLHTSIGPSQDAALCRNCSITYSFDNELEIMKNFF